MSEQYKLWLEVKDDYLDKVRKSLEDVDTNIRNQIIDDVSSHMDCRFGELAESQHNLETYQKITAEMGAPGEYADLMECRKSISEKSGGKNMLIVVIGSTVLLILILILAFLVFTKFHDNGKSSGGNEHKTGEKTQTENTFNSGKSSQ